MNKTMLIMAFFSVVPFASAMENSWVNLEDKSLSVCFENTTGGNAQIALDVCTLSQEEYFHFEKGFKGRDPHRIGILSNEPLSPYLMHDSPECATKFLLNGNHISVKDDNAEFPVSEVNVINMGRSNQLIASEVVTIPHDKEQTIKLTISEKVLWLGRLYNSDISQAITDYRRKDPCSALRVTLSGRLLGQITVSRESNSK